MNNNDNTPPDFARQFLNVASARLGAKAVAVSDEFFAPAPRMLAADEPVFVPGKFDAHGKWMDGWETRRRRGPGFDWAVVKFAAAARIVGVEIDTRHFTGNAPAACRLETLPPQIKINGATIKKKDAALAAAKGWQDITGHLPLQPDSRKWAALPETPAQAVRLNIYPDGGVARLRIYGRFARAPKRGEDFAAAMNGGRALAASDEHFGAAPNLLLPGNALNMGDGWETRRRRAPGYDWVVIALGGKMRPRRVEVDTSFFKGNFPASCSLHGGAVEDGMPDSAAVAAAMFWPEILPTSPLRANDKKTFQIKSDAPITHARFCIHPDGGVARLRIFGDPA